MSGRGSVVAPANRFIGLQQHVYICVSVLLYNIIIPTLFYCNLFLVSDQLITTLFYFFHGKYNPPFHKRRRGSGLATGIATDPDITCGVAAVHVYP